MVTGEAKEEVGSGNYDSVSGTETPKEEVQESNVDNDLERRSSHIENVRKQYGYGGAGSDVSNASNSKNISLTKNVNVVDGEINVCVLCGGSPCYWSQYGEDVITKTNAIMSENGDGAIYSLARKTAYKTFIFERFGYLGKYNRIQLPRCVLEAIRSEWPDTVGAYMGFKEQ